VLGKNGDAAEHHKKTKKDFFVQVIHGVVRVRQFIFPVGKILFWTINIGYISKNLAADILLFSEVYFKTKKTAHQRRTVFLIITGPV
jgi:hypothetical protein